MSSQETSLPTRPRAQKPMTAYEAVFVYPQRRKPLESIPGNSDHVEKPVQEVIERVLRQLKGDPSLCVATASDVHKETARRGKLGKTENQQRWTRATVQIVDGMEALKSRNGAATMKDVHGVLSRDTVSQLPGDLQILFKDLVSETLQR